MKKLLFACFVFVLILVASVYAFAANMGDVNNDGKVTAADARIILRHSAKLESIKDEFITIANTNSDNKITAADARIVLRVAAKLDSFEEPTTQKPTTQKPTTQETTTQEPTIAAQPDISISKNEYEIKPGETKVIVFSISNIEDYFIYLNFSEEETRDFIFDCKKYDDYAEVYVTAKDVLLCAIPIGSKNSADFNLKVSLMTNDKKIVDSEEIRIFSKYTDEEKANGFSIAMINHLYMEYDYVNENCNFYLSFADTKSNCIPTYGRVTITINDKEGDSVYSGVHDFIPDDFNVKSIENEEELLCCISVPFSEFAGNIIYEGEINLSIITPWINWNNFGQVRWDDISVPLPKFEENYNDNNNNMLTDPSACIDYGHLVNSGLCTRCSSYISADLSLFFSDENSNLLPAETTCNILGKKTTAIINKITNVSAVKNYNGTYDISVTAEIDVTSLIFAGDNGFFTVCLVDGNTNTTVMSNQISYNGYGKRNVTFNMENVNPGIYAVMFMNIDINM